jgi:putative cardiolipin synthase
MWHCFFTRIIVSNFRSNRFAIISTVAVLFLSACASLPQNVERVSSYAFTHEETSQTLIGKKVTELTKEQGELSGFHSLTEGIKAFAALIRLVNAAEKSLDLQYYIWKHDHTGKVLYQKLIEAADRGVRIRLLLDDYVAVGKDSFFHTVDAHPNIEIRLFNPFAHRGNRISDFLSDGSRVNRRMHNKSLIADNQAVVLGGRNIGNEYFDADEEISLTDIDVIAVGPVVDEVSKAFDLYWNSRWAYPVSAFPGKEVIDDEAVQALREQLKLHLEQNSETDYAKSFLITLSGLKDLTFSWGEWVFLYDQPSKVEAKDVEPLTHMAPRLKGKLDKTTKSLIIVSPYFVPGDTFSDYLIELVNKGVRVRVITNSLASTNVKIVHAGYIRYRKKLVRGGVELYEFKPQKEIQENLSEGQVKWGDSSESLLHGKLLSFDNQYLFVGSFNMDARSVVLNTEMGVYFESPQYAQEIAKSIDKEAMVKAYRVMLTENDSLQWHTLEEGKEVRFNSEPETTLFQRIKVNLLSLIVPESQL